MRKVSTLIATAAVIGAAFSVFRWGPSLATSFSGGGSTLEAHILSAPVLEVSGSVEARPPDGGMVIAGVVPTTVENEPGVRVTTPVEVSGLSGAPVLTDTTITNTPNVSVVGTASVSVTNTPSVNVANVPEVSISAASLQTLTATTGKGNCTYVDGDPTATIGTTAADIPAVPMFGRTALEIFNHSTAPANHLLCSAQGTATTTSGVRIESGHQSRKWEGLGAGVLVSCRCVTGTCTYNYQEEQCYQP